MTGIKDTDRRHTNGTERGDVRGETQINAGGNVMGDEKGNGFVGSVNGSVVDPSHGIADLEITVPTLFGDIDGVLSSMWRGLQNVTYGEVKAGAFHVLFLPEVVQAVNDLVRDGLVEFCWLTSWDRSAQTDFAPAVGLDNFPRIIEQHDHRPVDLADPTRGWWKELHVREHCRTSATPYIWCDDEIDNALRHDEGQDTARVAMERDYPGRGLMISPNKDKGLDMTHVARIDEFCRAHRTSELLRVEALRNTGASRGT